MMDCFEILPGGPIHATVSAPPSKSYTNRAYVIAALSDGEVIIERPLFSDDTRYMREALNEFGIPVTEKGNIVTVQGQGGKLKTPDKEIFVGNAGTTMRFLTTLSTLAQGKVTLTGDERMQERPIGDLISALSEMGTTIQSVKSNGCPPLTIEGSVPPGGTVHLAGDKSSQYLTSILMSAPYFKNDTTVEIVGDLTSKPYADITLDIMKTFGVSVENDCYQRFQVSANQKYKAQRYRVEGDASSASYFFAMAAVTGGEVTVTHVNPNSAQGDIRFPEYLLQMGCDVRTVGDTITVKGNPLRGITVHMNDTPDVVQTLAVVALFADGPTTITGIANLRIKETDRIGALAIELTRLGAEVEVQEDSLTILPKKLHAADIETYHDHRMAMSFAVAGLKIPGLRIINPRCVEKSFPDFFQQFESLYV